MESPKNHMEAGLFIHGGVESTSRKVINAIASLRSVLRMPTVESTRQVLMTLPTTITLDDIIEYEQEWCQKNNKPFKFTTQDALERAQEAANQLATHDVKAEVISPEAIDADASEIAEYAQMVRAGGTVMFYGPTGCGKTAKARAAFKAAGLTKVAYYSMPTLAPEDFAGIPSPDPKNDHLFFYRMLSGITDCEGMILDETNRAHPKILNAIMQLMLERRINDMDFPSLKSIILCINPPDAGDYIGTEELDQAVRERIDYFIEIPNRPSASILAKLFAENPTLPPQPEERFAEVANIIVDWFNTLSDAMKKMVNARRLEKLGIAHFHGINLHVAVDKAKDGSGVPVDRLVKMLKSLDVLTLDYLRNHTDEVEAVMAAGGQAAADYEYRFIELVKHMHRRGMKKDIVKVGHLFNYVAKDKLPNPDRERSFWGFITRAYKTNATPEEYENFKSSMEARARGTEAVKAKIARIGQQVSQPDPTAVTV